MCVCKFYKSHWSSCGNEDSSSVDQYIDHSVVHGADVGTECCRSCKSHWEALNLVFFIYYLQVVKFQCMWLRALHIQHVWHMRICVCGCGCVCVCVCVHMCVYVCVCVCVYCHMLWEGTFRLSFKVFTAVWLIILVFCGGMLHCSVLSNILNAIHSFGTSETTHSTMQCHPRRENSQNCGLCSRYGTYN